MHRFYLPPAECREATLTLTGREAHHGLHVLRLQRGQQVAVLDGAGHEYLCEAKELDRAAIHLAVIQQKAIPPLPYQVTLLQAIPKGKVLEAIIQKATELEVSRIVPLLSERVVPHLDPELAGKKVAKWQAVAIEAVKQCGAAWLPQIEPPASLQAYLARAEKFDLPLIASLQGDSQHPRDAFRNFQRQHQRLPQSVCIWVGPEGDFTPAEVAAVQAAGALPITLGRSVLRSETAAIYCLSVLKYELEHGSP